MKPELLASAPNMVWSWDITKLRGPDRGIYYDLYVILDIFSRYVVGWTVAASESGDLAKDLITDALTRHQIPPRTLTIHADRGTSMTSKPVSQLLIDLGVVRSHGRPHVSNDNPYSEAAFKRPGQRRGFGDHPRELEPRLDLFHQPGQGLNCSAAGTGSLIADPRPPRPGPAAIREPYGETPSTTLKYCPAFPDRFGSIADARAFAAAFMAYYNHEHRHSGIGLHTPASVHYGTATEIRAQRTATLDAAYAANPQRFTRRPVPPKLPTLAWINEPIREVIQSS